MSYACWVDLLGVESPFFFFRSMNYGLGKNSLQTSLLMHIFIPFPALSLKLEKFLAQLEAEGADDSAEECLEDRAMKMAQEEIFEESGRQFKPWCANGKSLRMGEIILIIDSDTVVPEDCFRDAAREMGESPDVAIIQHESGVNPFFSPLPPLLTDRAFRCHASCPPLF